MKPPGSEKAASELYFIFNHIFSQLNFMIKPINLSHWQYRRQLFFEPTAGAFGYLF